MQRPLTSIIALPRAHVRKVADLAGKTRRHGRHPLPGGRAADRRCRRPACDPASVKEVNVGFNLVPAMLSGKVAATLGGFWNYEAIQLQQLHKHPLVIPVDRAGVPTYDELVLVVREDEARKRGQDLRAFMQALTRGEREVRADPAAAAALRRQGQPVAGAEAAAGIDQADAAGRRCRAPASRSAGRRPRRGPSFGALDVRPRAAQARPERGAAAVHQRVPRRARASSDRIG